MTVPVRPNLSGSWRKLASQPSSIGVVFLAGQTLDSLGKPVGQFVFFRAISDTTLTTFTVRGLGSPVGEGFGMDNVTFGNANPTVVPVPAALRLLASGLGALGALGWRRKRKAAAAA